MKLKPMLKYELRRSLGLLLGFYIFVVALFPSILHLVLMPITGNFSPASLLDWFVNLIPSMFWSLLRSSSSMDTAIMSFLFLLGLITFSPSFHFSQSQNISRKTMFSSHLIHVCIVSGTTALLNGMLSFLSSFDTGRVLPSVPEFFWTFYKTIIFSTSSRLNTEKVIDKLRSPQFIGEYFLWTFCVSAMMLMLGYLIGLLFYRLTRGLRRRTVITTPAFLLPLLSYLLIYLFSAIDYFFPNFWQLSTPLIFYPLYSIYPFAQNSPYFSMLYYLVLFTIFTVSSWFLIRRATISAPDPATAAEQIN